MKRLFTSESVTCGHPDKMCDQISDAILDAYLHQDKNARVACEVCVSNNLVLIVGEISSSATINIEQIARKVITEIGYDNDEVGFNGNACKIIQNINCQSSDIAMGVDSSMETKEKLYDQGLGAGDQGLMFGYACNETEACMPLAISLAHNLAKQLEMVRRNRIMPYLRPDGKTQVTIEYDDDIPKRVDAIVVSCQHNPYIENYKIKEDIIVNVIAPIIQKSLLDDQTKIFINPTGQFVIGGPLGDSGLTGRKIIVDTYGGYGHHGGGAFSGKDYTKVDRTASYYARYVAKNIVASKIATKCEIQVSYAIGVAKPIAVSVNTFNTGVVADDKTIEIINKVFDFRPSSIINQFELKKLSYQPLATYGHFGRDELNIPWEQTDKVDAIQKFLKLN